MISSKRTLDVLILFSLSASLRFTHALRMCRDRAIDLAKLFASFSAAVYGTCPRLSSDTLLCDRLVIYDNRRMLEACNVPRTGHFVHVRAQYSCRPQARYQRAVQLRATPQLHRNPGNRYWILHMYAVSWCACGRLDQGDATGNAEGADRALDLYAG